ncbi:MAG: DUF4097 family beta strand repeat protein, partial [Spirochaetales bacterium]|nr:DUF4097 family beta strand repeat protein [Spirochaetales bacterium]
GYSPEELELVQIKVTEGETLTVVSDYSNDPMSSVSVDYTITLPADITVSVQNITGNVSVDGITFVDVLSLVTGDIEVTHCERVSEIQSTTGSIEVEIEQTEGDVTIRTTTGNITAWVDPEVNAGLYPSVVTGSYSGPNYTPYGNYRINLSVVTGNITVYNL